MSLHNRIITHKDLHPKTANQKELFHSASSLDWQPMTDHSRGMQSVIQLESQINTKQQEIQAMKACLARKKTVRGIPKFAYPNAPDHSGTSGVD